MGEELLLNSNKLRAIGIGMIERSQLLMALDLAVGQIDDGLEEMFLRNALAAHQQVGWGGRSRMGSLRLSHSSPNIVHHERAPVDMSRLLPISLGR